MQLITKDLALTLKQDQIYRLGYNSYNEGEFLWKHISTQLINTNYGDLKRQVRLLGLFKYEDMGEWDGPRDYLYEFKSAICRGSGAEPCWILEEGETSSNIRPYEGWIEDDGSKYIPND